MKEEILKDIEGYKGLYQVSNFGRVKSMERVVLIPSKVRADQYRRLPERILSPGNNGRGYMYVHLYADGVFQTCLIHRLVAESFIPNTNCGLEVDHINTIRNDNRVENLKWVSSSENNLNPITRNKNFEAQPKGKNHPNSKRVLQYSLDGTFIKEWGSAGEVHRSLGIDQSFLSACCRGKYKTGFGFKWKYAE